MKKIFSIMLCAIIMAACSTAAVAQNSDSNHKRMTREQLAEAQAKHIAHELALDDATTAQFVTTYSDYQKEVWALGPRLGHKQKQETTDADAEQAIKQRMERSQKILNLREKYYKKYSQFLTQKQIERVYELERQSMKRLGKNSHQRKGRGAKSEQK